MKKYLGKTFLAIIPARKNSKRIQNKNLKKIGKKTLVEISIGSALSSKYVSQVCITSDSKKILSTAKKIDNKVVLINRPKNLANSIIMPDAAVIHAYKQINKKFDYIVMLQPTSIFRNSHDIDLAIKKIINDKADSLISVTKTHNFFWEKVNKFYKPINYNPASRPRSQDFEQFKENGSIYITKSDKFLKDKNRISGKCTIFKMKDVSSLDIDTVEDLKLARLIKKKYDMFRSWS
jgi:CMP-N,N'-diacetyllegionaminic acid synthase